MKPHCIPLFLSLLMTSCSSVQKPPSVEAAPKQLSLWEIAQTLQSKSWVDLTHTFDRNTPHWKGFKPMGRKDLFTIRKDGFHVEQFCHVGQWGTHVDPPAHFHEGLRNVENIPVDQMLLPLVVIDVHDKAEKNPDYVLTLDDIKTWEKKYGTIPQGAFVAMRTDWSKRWPDDRSMQNLDRSGTAHYPGWSAETLKLLFEERKITATGHETTDTDPGLATTKDDYSLESYILKTNHYQIELLANLDRVPEAGALVVVSWPKVAHGSGFPARVFAILP
ncbi:MAG: cyclase family protein [Bdellovibrionota bacterium]